ncbi:two-component system, OmpR family, sensor histidine kinase KdpD [Hathewaya proteolytica DSM 3090]|uniref:histidine kinase n=1 Tax=Hathewaya proteolytica DSM 3090 TaxID=1121331 RepID=A0A1M6SN39_9CLOT|nr:sensor histidine kinase KdpD [Hathewaya proteolytica]SHK46115.1 two-component system, OmpR family, sensor histidine kinase KdpD [Hathewaya proteolytica DSM 3090]
MDDVRANPDELLKAIQNEEKERKLGQLKIFFGYAAGVGKTYAMLQAAKDAKSYGIDVVAGYVEPHERLETSAMLEGLEIVPPQKIKHNNMVLKEFDIDATLKRNPQLVLVDELAHTNARGCRHNKRYKDVQELLKVGIDVYTTVNVQHLESLNDIVASITGVMVRERIPDKMFDDAQQVELIDIEPTELIERLREGKIYRKIQAEKAVTNFFAMENLVALREIAMRRCADRINKISDSERVKSNGEYFTDEHILVCLSPSPSGAKSIRTAARMASAFKGDFTALFVETPSFSSASQEDKKNLRDNIHLAQQLGANVETSYGDDVALQISEFARLSGISKIVVGRSSMQRKHFFSKPTFIEKLTAYAPNLDIYIIPDKRSSNYKSRNNFDPKPKFNMADLWKSISILVIATIICHIFYNVGFSEANIITVYIMGVLVTSIIVSERIYSLVFSVISVLTFNFFFTEPRFTLNAYGSGYPATFAIMLISTFITGTLATKIKKNAKQSAQTAFRTKVLFDTNQLLQKAREKSDIIDITANQIIKLLDKDIVFYPSDMENLMEPQIFTVSGRESNNDYTSKNEKAVAAWVFKNNKHAGATTSTLCNAKCLYLAVRVNNNVYGVVGIVIGQSPLESFENSILLSILGECALALENRQAEKEKEEAAVLAKNEQLRASLLRAISHDLRTPLTSISGNAGILISDESTLVPEKRKQLYNDIYDDSMWLINLVENLLAVTKIEDGTLNLNMSSELMEDVIREALSHIDRKSVEHNIIVKETDEFIMAKMDSKLIMQVIINIVDNAIKYTPKGSNINISTWKTDDKVFVKIADDGLGISDESKPRIFDMFYIGDMKIVDSRRSLGLGLALCKSIINVHNGEIWVKDNKPFGTVFQFNLPAEEVNLRE